MRAVLRKFWQTAAKQAFHLWQSNQSTFIGVLMWVYCVGCYAPSLQILLLWGNRMHPHVRASGIFTCRNFLLDRAHKSEPSAKHHTALNNGRRQAFSLTLFPTYYPQPSCPRTLGLTPGTRPPHLLSPVALLVEADTMMPTAGTWLVYSMAFGCFM